MSRLLESRVGLLEVGMPTRQNNVSAPDMHTVVTQAVSSVVSLSLSVCANHLCHFNSYSASHDT